MAIIGDVALQNFMPRNILESDDDLDAWSSGSGSHCSEGSGSYISPREWKNPTDYCLYEDYFGLNNLVNNIKISDDNPLVCNVRDTFAMQPRGRRISWESDGSDSAAILSPTIDNAPSTYDKVSSSNSGNIDPAMSQYSLPSMRLSKAMRDHIISGAYQQNINRRCQVQEKSPVPGNFVPAQGLRQNVVQQPVPTSQSNSTTSGNTGGRTTGLQVCVFCRNNGENESVYSSHVVKDPDGRTSCPILRAYTCPICKANGDNSHTIKYCPMNQNARISSSMAGVMSVAPQGLNMGPHPQRAGCYKTAPLPPVSSVPRANQQQQQQQPLVPKLRL